MIVLQQEQILTRHTVVTSAKVIEEIGLENMKIFFSNSKVPWSELINPRWKISIMWKYSWP